jgi:hypothetical protein
VHTDNLPLRNSWASQEIEEWTRRTGESESSSASQEIIMMNRLMEERRKKRGPRFLSPRNKEETGASRDSLSDNREPPVAPTSTQAVDYDDVWEQEAKRQQQAMMHARQNADGCRLYAGRTEIAEFNSSRTLDPNSIKSIDGDFKVLPVPSLKCSDTDRNSTSAVEWGQEDMGERKEGRLKWKSTATVFDDDLGEYVVMIEGE